MVTEPDRFGDHRGFFAETYSQRAFAELGINPAFVQHYQSLLASSDTVRGWNFHAPPHVKAKLVRCSRGAIFDLAGDIRKGGPTYARLTGYEFSAKNGAQLFIPAGFATLQRNSEIVYKCSDYFAPETKGALRRGDPAIDITWSVQGDPILSGKDFCGTVSSRSGQPDYF